MASDHPQRKGYVERRQPKYQHHQQQHGHSPPPAMRSIATTYRDLDNDPWLRLPTPSKSNDYEEPWLPIRDTCRAKAFREVSPNSQRTGSGIYIDNREVPLPHNLPRKRHRVAPHVMQGMAMLPPPVLCNVLQHSTKTNSSPVIAPVAALPSAHHQDYGWTSYVRGDEEEEKEESFSFREAAFALTTLCGRKVVSSEGLVVAERAHNASPSSSSNDTPPTNAAKRKRER